MRDIKFRAWNKEQNIMYHNAQNTYDFGCCSGYGGCPEDHFGVVIQKKDYILMQYTGEKDINGIEIYEGDIVETTRGLNHIIGAVIYRKASWYIQSKEGYNVRLISIFFTAENKIIGNVYENKKLLEERYE